MAIGLPGVIAVEFASLEQTLPSASNLPSFQELRDFVKG